MLENSQEFAQSLTNQVFQGFRICAHEVLIMFLTVNHTFLSTNYILWACSMDSGPWPSSKSSLGSLSFFSRLCLRVKYCTDFWFGSFTIQVLLTFPLNWSFDEEGPVSGPSGPALPLCTACMSYLCHSHLFQLHHHVLYKVEEGHGLFCYTSEEHSCRSNMLFFYQGHVR